MVVNEERRYLAIASRDPVPLASLASPGDDGQCYSENKHKFIQNKYNIKTIAHQNNTINKI